MRDALVDALDVEYVLWLGKFLLQQWQHASLSNLQAL